MAPVEVWEKEFETTFHAYREVSASVGDVEEGSRRRVLRAPTYTLPEEVAGCVDAVLNAVELPMRRMLGGEGLSAAQAAEAVDALYRDKLREDSAEAEKQEAEAQSVSSSTYFTPSSLAARYGIPAPTSSTIGAATLSVMENEQYLSPSDLTTFQTSNGMQQQALFRNYGGHARSQPCSITGTMSQKQNETAFQLCRNANLATQYAMAVAPGVSAPLFVHPTILPVLRLPLIPSLTAGFDHVLVPQQPGGGLPGGLDTRRGVPRAAPAGTRRNAWN